MRRERGRDQADSPSLQDTLTRRAWTALVAAVPLAAQVASPPPVGLPPAPTEPGSRLQKANSDIRAVSDQLSKIEVPIFVEPAFTFRV